MNFEPFLKLHKDLPREGPGSDSATLRALSMVPALPDNPRILDIGCGPGKQTITLAKELGATVIGVDIFDQYLDQLRRSAMESGVDHLVKTRNQSMDALDDPDGSIDLIWAEASIYSVGFEKCLRIWKRLLKPKGVVVASELTWLQDEPDSEILDYWSAQYPEMTTISGNIKRAEASGYETLNHFILEERAWWDEYLIPLENRIESLKTEIENDPDLASVVSEQETENLMVKKWHGQFGYVFYIMRNKRPV